MKGGLDLGGTNIQAVVTSEAGKSVAEAKRATPRTGGPEAVVGELAAALRDALTTANLDAGSLESVGVGVPGSIDTRSGTVLQVANVPGFAEPFALAPSLSQELGVPVAIGNDVTVAVEAERRYGAGTSFESFIGVYWGTGVGGGIVIDGRLLSGRGSAGEIGHVCTKPGGRRCACGLEGCVEAYAGRGALEERARALSRRRKTVLFDLMEKRGRDRLTSGVWAKALDAGDKLAQDLLDRAVQALGVGIGSAVTLLDVEAVIIGGGLGVRLGEEWVERIERAARPHTFFRDHPAYRLSELGDLGGAIGASLLRPAPEPEGARDTSVATAHPPGREI
jgi:glucokinase